MSQEHLLEIIRLLIAGLFGAIINQVLNHWLVIRRSKKDSQRQHLKEKLRSLYAPLLIQSNLLKNEIDAWNKILQQDSGNTPATMALKKQVLFTHSSNMIEIKENITKLISKNYNLINENDEKYIMSFVESMQKVSLMKLDMGNVAFVDINEKSENEHPFELLLKSIGLLRTDLEPAIRHLKLKIES